MYNQNYLIEEVERYLVALDSKCERESAWILDMPWDFRNRCTYLDRVTAYRDGMYSALLRAKHCLAERFYQASDIVIELYLEKIDERDPMKAIVGA